MCVYTMHVFLLRQCQGKNEITISIDKVCPPFGQNNAGMYEG